MRNTAKRQITTNTYILGSDKSDRTYRAYSMYPPYIE